jgi:hypothetical protein
MKPIIRWTIGSVQKSGYDILCQSIKNIIKLYSKKFEYFVCYNDVDLKEINKLKNIFNINFIEQKWESCPLMLPKPAEQNKITKQKINGSFWKICPPRLEINTHEIILDNDLIFLKKPKIIEEFLSVDNKNLIVKDSNSNTNQTFGIYEKLFRNKNQGYNSGVIGLYPSYDFKKHIVNNFLKNENHLNYSDEQGLLIKTLMDSNHLVGDTKDFSDIRTNFLYCSCLTKETIEKHGLQKNKTTQINKKLLYDVFKNSSVVHFIKSNREKNLAWEYFQKTKNRFI